MHVYTYTHRFRIKSLSATNCSISLRVFLAPLAKFSIIKYIITSHWLILAFGTIPFLFPFPSLIWHSVYQFLSPMSHRFVCITLKPGCQHKKMVSVNIQNVMVHILRRLISADRLRLSIWLLGLHNVNLSWLILAGILSPPTVFPIARVCLFIESFCSLVAFNNWCSLTL